jgi:ribosomal protein S27AE
LVDLPDRLELAGRTSADCRGDLEGVEMIESKCPNCGHGIFDLARACPRCGAPRGRFAGMMVAGALGLLLVAAVVALVVVLRGDRLAAATETGVPADEHIMVGSMADVSWLATAMSGCDAEARTAPGRLLFLVTPLTPVVHDIAPWHAKSINDMGNGILLRSDDTLDGLKSGTLRFYPADYAFRILDPAGEAIYKWRPSLGVTKFSTADAGPIATFKVQFGTAHSGGDSEWGGSFTRQNGACHWVNAIINH